MPDISAVAEDILVFGSYTVYINICRRYFSVLSDITRTGSTPAEGPPRPKLAANRMLN